MFIIASEDGRLRSETSFLEYSLDRQSWCFVSPAATRLGWSSIFALNEAPIKPKLSDYFDKLLRKIKR